jgi:hypothetical protein
MPAQMPRNPQAQPGLAAGQERPPFIPPLAARLLLLLRKEEGKRVGVRAGAFPCRGRPPCRSAPAPPRLGVLRQPSGAFSRHAPRCPSQTAAFIPLRCEPYRQRRAVAYRPQVHFLSKRGCSVHVIIPCMLANSFMSPSGSSFSRSSSASLSGLTWIRLDVHSALRRYWSDMHP